MFYLILACIFTLPGLFAQAAVPSQLVPVEGSVVNKITGTPVKHAHVQYMQVDSKVSSAANRNPPLTGSTDTNSEGQFVIQVAPGSYQLWVEQPGFDRQYDNRTDGPQTIVAALGQQVPAVTLQIVPLGAISGHIFDQDGDPLQGVNVQVMKFTYITGRRQLTPVSGTGSDDRGEYRAYGLPAGRYLLLATRREWPAYAGLFYPGVPDVASATPISLSQGGDVTGIDFSLPILHLVTVRGHLLSPVTNFAGSQLQVVLAHREANAASYFGRALAVVNQTTGTFEVRDVMPGSYWLVAAQLCGKYALGGRVPLEVVEAAASENVSVPLTSGFEIRGRVELDGVGKLPSMKVGLRASENLTLGPQPTSTVGPDGDIRLDGVTPGVWDLVFDSLPGNFCVKSATLSDADFLRQEISLSGDSSEPLLIAVSTTCSEISGTVTDENGQPHHATVVMAPAEPELRQSPQVYQIASTEDHGTFVFKGVRPGSYKLFALKQVAPFAWLDPDFFAQIEPMAESLSVAEGEKATLRLILISPENLPPGR